MTEVYIDPFILLIRKARAEGRAEGLAERRAEGLAERRAEGISLGRAESKAENDKLRAQLQAMCEKFDCEPQDMHL